MSPKINDEFAAKTEWTRYRLDGPNIKLLGGASVPAILNVAKDSR